MLLKARDKKEDPMTRPLTIRESLFLLGIAQGLNYRQAALKAGYKGYHPKPMYGNPRLRHEVLKLMEEQIERAKVSQVWKMLKLKRCADVSMPDDFKDLSEFEKELVSATNAISAIAELNKMQGHYAPTKTVNAQIVNEADTEELKQLIEEHKREY